MPTNSARLDLLVEAPIRTPFGIAPDCDPPPPEDARLLALCGDQALLEAELGRAIAQIDALRRRVAALERRRPRRGRPA